MKIVVVSLQANLINWKGTKGKFLHLNTILAWESITGELSPFEERFKRYIYIYPLQGCKVLNGENYGCTCVCVCVWKRSSIIVHLDFFSKLSKLWNAIRGVVNKLKIWIFLCGDQEESIWIKIYEHCTRINV